MDVTKPRQLRRQEESTGHTHHPNTAPVPFEYERALWLLVDCILLFFFQDFIKIEYVCFFSLSFQVHCSVHLFWDFLDANFVIW